MTFFNNSGSKSKNQFEIGMLEIRRHVSDLYAFSTIFKTRDTNVTIFTTKQILSRLKILLDNIDNYNIVLKKDKENVLSFLRRVQSICNDKIDLLFINTIHETVFDLIWYLNFRPKCKMVLNVHHANAWLKPKLVFNIKHPIRSIDTNLSSALISKFIFPKFDAINVPYSPMKHYILNETNYDKEIFAVPTTFYEGKKRKKTIRKQEDDVKLRIAIPGLIQEHRKDYEVVLPVLENLFKQFNGNLAVDVPGWPVDRYGDFVYKKFEQMKNKGYNIVIFNDFVPDDAFDEILEKCDIILAPIRINTRADSEIEEQYGITVSSGSVYDAIRFGKPVITPSEFNMIEELKSSTLTYNSSKDLEKAITELVLSPRKLEKLKKEAILNAEKFSSFALQQYFEKNVLDWIQKKQSSKNKKS